MSKTSEVVTEVINQNHWIPWEVRWFHPMVTKALETLAQRIVELEKRIDQLES